MKTIVISDIHLGTRSSRCADLLKCLKKEDWDRLIILGDLFEDGNFNRLKKKQWKFLTYIREQTAPEMGRSVIWVEGNHDKYAIRTIAPLIGARTVYDDAQYTMQCGGREYLFLHGHTFDDWIVKKRVTSAVASYGYAFMQTLDTKDQKICRSLKSKSKNFLRVRDAIADRAMDEAGKSRSDVVVCGHVHFAEQRKCEERGIEYVNTGCATDVPGHYLLITKSGHKLVQY